MTAEKNIDLKASPLSDHILEWKNLSLSIPKSDKIILHPQSGSLGSGKVLAIMGPSGAGKTSFLDVISQRVLSSDPGASITFDGHRFSMRDLGSYVSQDNALHGFLTVKDNLRYSALLSLPHDTPTNVIDGVVKKTLRSLGLTDVRKNRIGTYFERGISRGQKRRVTIASSVITQPRILLCDEPMSGLDSTTGYQVASAIKRLAQETNTVVLASIHQPDFETFSLFDHVLFLASGHCVYQGPIGGVVSYFVKIGYPCPPHVNPADHVINIINTNFDVAETDVPNHERIQQLAEAWIAHASNLNPLGSDLDKRSSVGITSPGPGTTLGGVETVFEPEPIRTQKSWNYRVVAEVRRTWILTQRTALIIRRNVMLTGLRLLTYGAFWNGKGATSVLLATVWLHMEKTDARVNDRISVHFFSLAVLSGMSVAAVPLYLEERPVFIREYVGQVRPVCFPASPSFSIPRRNNGLYGAGVYTIANTVRGSLRRLFRSFMYAAEAQALLVAAIIPNFVGALAFGGSLRDSGCLLVQNDFEGETLLVLLSPTDRVTAVFRAP
ncbi:hypothetical protein BS47DRAFT_1362754 [Hydnum rufescens UP504]|uniref:ABC transporter domain-containing protein n=1 Tax=Hydnum rufescens UP504 TaxID=1448309 RepID=A0A9P6AWQ8_9AGAM|nr:hypothetical protein BS47DRAFT_1362754 [Hydnum rufescens UP504]